MMSSAFAGLISSEHRDIQEDSVLALESVGFAIEAFNHIDIIKLQH